MSHHPSHTDTRIDQILNTLRTTEPPAGLESRIAARLSQATEAQATEAQAAEVQAAEAQAAKAQAAEVRQASATQARILTKSRLAVILSGAHSAQSKDPRILLAPARLYPIAAALTLLLSVSLIAYRSLGKTQLAPANTQLAPANTQLAQAPSVATTPVPQGFSLGSHSPTQRAGVLTPALPDPDTIALAETLAPSHPAPPLPLTPQERLLQSATQPGAPIELAELDLAREPVLRAAAQAHEKAALQQFVRSLVSQLVTSESFDPTPDSDAQPSTPTSSSTNEPPTNGASQ